MTNNDVTKTISNTSCKYACVAGTFDASFSGTLDETALRRLIAKEVGHKNFFIVPNSIERSKAVYRMGFDAFMSIAKPRGEFLPAKRVVTVTLYGTTVTYMTPDGSDTLYIDGKSTDAQQRKAIATKLGHKNFFITEAALKHDEYAVSLDTFLANAELVQ